MKIGVVAYSFGAPADIPPNRLIGSIAVSTARRLQAVGLYTQADIRFKAPDIKTVYTEEKVGFAPPTLRVSRGAVRWAISEGIEILWVVAAQPHMWRCLRDLRAAIVEVDAQIEVRVVQDCMSFKSGTWFCAKSTQERTTSCINWIVRDTILRLMPYSVYRRVAE